MDIMTLLRILFWLCCVRKGRHLGLKYIMKVRAGTKSKDVHSFSIPPLNFVANDYVDLISWQECTMTESSLTFEIADQQ
jgi:hypothetical protein